MEWEAYRAVVSVCPHSTLGSVPLHELLTIPEHFVLCKLVKILSTLQASLKDCII